MLMPPRGRRAEYHALKDQIKAGQTYYMGYRFAVNQLQAGTFIFQWKEYADTNETDLGMSIPFYLRFGASGNLQLQAGRPGMSPIVIWEKAILSRKVIDIGMEIVPKRQSGTVKMWYNGNRVTFNIDGNKNQVWKGTTMPESSSPKWGAYRGEEAQIDTWIYKVQFGQNKGELDQAFFSA
jgi:hypothetical protein